MFYFIDAYNNIFLVNYHKFRNFIQFCNEWAVQKKAYFALDIVPAYVLVSAKRRFESQQMKCFKHKVESLF